jgi:O-antigen/teichoic acid export membrane protein
MSDGSERAVMPGAVSRRWAALRQRRSALRIAGFVAMRLSQHAILFVCGLLSARLLGPVGRAQYALVLALGSTVWLLAHLSLDLAVARIYARQEARLTDLVRIRATFVVLVGIVGAGVALGLGLAFPQRLVGDAPTTAVVLGAITVPLWLAVYAAGGILLLVGDNTRYALAGAGAALLQLALLIAVAVATPLTPELALVTTVAGLAVNALIFAILLGRAVAWRALIPSADWRLGRRILKVGATMHPAIMGLALSVQLDLFCLAALGSAREVGYYSVAATLAGSVFMAINAVAQAVWHRQMDPDQPEAAALTVRFARRTAVLTCGLAVAGVALGYPLIRIAYGAEWTSSVAPFMVLIVAAVPLMIQTPTTAFLARSARPLWFALGGVAVVALNVALNLVLIPPLGTVGCALATLITYAAYATSQLLLFRRITGWPVRAFFTARGVTAPVA